MHRHAGEGWAESVAESQQRLQHKNVDFGGSAGSIIAKMPLELLVWGLRLASVAKSSAEDVGIGTEAVGESTPMLRDTDGGPAH